MKVISSISISRMDPKPERSPPLGQVTPTPLFIQHNFTILGSFKSEKIS